MTSLPENFIETYASDLRRCLELFSLAERSEPLEVSREADEILYRIAARATKTFRAVLHLCTLGHGEQATMLNRSLFEDLLTAHWVDLNPDEAVERLRKHERHTAMLWKEHLAGRGLELGALADLPDLTDEERKELQSLFGPRGQTEWTGLSTYKLVKAVEASWGDEGERFLLWHMHDVHLKHANKTLHMSAEALLRPTAHPERPDLLIYDAGPSDRDVPIALFAAFWASANLMRLVLPGSQRDTLVAFYRENMPLFFRPVHARQRRQRAKLQRGHWRVRHGLVRHRPSRPATRSRYGERRVRRGCVLPAVLGHKGDACLRLPRPRCFRRRR
jgi:hypothetical protein